MTDIQEVKAWKTDRKDLPAFVSACLTGEMMKYQLGDIIEVVETLTTREEVDTFIRSYDDMLKSHNKDFTSENIAYLMSECISDSFRYTWEEAFFEYFGTSVDNTIDAMLTRFVP